MIVANLELSIPERKGFIFRNPILVENQPTDVTPNIDSPSPVEVENNFFRSGTKNEYFQTDIEVKGESIIKGRLLDFIKKWYNNNTAYDVEIFIEIEVEE